MNIRTIGKIEEHGTQFCNRNRAREYCTFKNKRGQQHSVVKAITYRNCEPVYCYTVILK